VKTQNPRLDYIVVLSPEMDSDGNFVDVLRSDSVGEASYIGGDIRMRGLLECCKDYPNAEYILVGKKLHQGSFPSEPAVIRRYLQDHGCQVKTDLVISGSCTWCNLEAVAEHRPGVVQSSYMAPFSNWWHCQRSLLLWRALREKHKEMEIPITPVTFLAAEFILDSEFAEPENKQYHQRKKQEEGGADAIRDRTYIHSCTGQPLFQPRQPLAPSLIAAAHA
jgi:hypothetical protein